MPGQHGKSPESGHNPCVEKEQGDFPGMKKPGRNEVTVSTGYISCKRYSNYNIKLGGFMEYLLKGTSKNWLEMKNGDSTKKNQVLQVSG